MSRDDATVRPGSLHDTEPCTEPCPAVHVEDTWPSPGQSDTELKPGVPTDPAPAGMSPVDFALALRPARVPAFAAEYLEGVAA